MLGINRGGIGRQKCSLNGRMKGMGRMARRIAGSNRKCICRNDTERFFKGISSIATEMLRFCSMCNENVSEIGMLKEKQKSVQNYMEEVHGNIKSLELPMKKVSERN